MEQTNHLPEKNNRELEPGEMICDKCNGEGHFDGGVYLYITCKKCNGEGIVDWVENIVGKPSVVYTYEDAISSVAQSMAEEIDKQILESVLKESEQTVKLICK